MCNALRLDNSKSFLLERYTPVFLRGFTLEWNFFLSFFYIRKLWSGVSLMKTKRMENANFRFNSENLMRKSRGAHQNWAVQNFPNAIEFHAIGLHGEKRDCELKIMIASCARFESFISIQQMKWFPFIWSRCTQNGINQYRPDIQYVQFLHTAADMAYTGECVRVYRCIFPYSTNIRAAARCIAL